MSIQTDVTATKAFADRETNPTLLRNWEFPIAFAMSQVGVTELTEASLPLFMARQAMWYPSFGGKSPFGEDPTIVEMFLGMKVWGRHSQGQMTDAAFGRHIVGLMKNNVGDLARRYHDRKPGDFLHNMTLEDVIAGKCRTCPSHHTQDYVHDGERTETDENEEREDICMYLRGHGYPTLADDLGGETIETVRSEYRRITGKDWVNE